MTNSETNEISKSNNSINNAPNRVDEILLSDFRQAMESFGEGMKAQNDLSIRIGRRTTQIIRISLIGMFVIGCIMFFLIWTLTSDMHKMTNYMNKMHQDFSSIKKDMHVIQGSVSGLDNSIKGMEQSVDGMSQNMSQLNTNVYHMTEDMRKMSTNVDEMTNPMGLFPNATNNNPF